MATATAETESVERIDPGEAQRHVEEGNALLVCAYDTDEKGSKYRLDSSIPLTALDRASDSLSPDQELIFYCA